MARTGGQRTAPFRLPLYSSSQMKQAGIEELGLEGCELRWGLNRILRLEEDFGEKAAMGVERHEELEKWGRLGIMPTLKEAKAAMRFSPAPRTAAIEVPVRFDLPHSSWIGYVDVCFDWRLDPGPCSPPEQPDEIEGVKKGFLRAFGKPAGRPAPLGTTGVTVIQDYKFTTGWDYALTSPELFNDFAANLYAKEAWEGGATRVFCRWVYTLWGSQSPREVWCEMSRENGARILAIGDARAAYLNEVRQKVARGEMSVYDLPIDTGQCFAYGKVCPRKGKECNPATRPRMKPRSQQDMDQDFEAETAQNFAPPKTLPPLPAKKSLSPLPGKALPPLPGARPVDSKGFTPTAEHRFDTGTGEPLKDNPSAKKLPPLPGKTKPGPDLKAIAKVEADYKALHAPEAGFVNPTGGPAVAVASPEEAVASGNVHVPESAEEPEPDDLEGKSIAELREIAHALGAVHAPKAKTAGVTHAIRARRAEMELNGEVTTDAEVEAIAEATGQSFEQVHADQACGYEEAQHALDNAIHAELSGADGAAEAVEAAERQLDALTEQVLKPQLERTQKLLEAYKKPPESAYEKTPLEAARATSVADMGAQLKALAGAAGCKITLEFAADTE